MPITILILIINRLGSTRFDLAPLGVAMLPAVAWLGFARLGSEWLRGIAQASDDSMVQLL